MDEYLRSLAKVHEDDGFPEDAKEILKAADKMKLLQSIVDKLQKTKDNVPVVAGVDNVFWPGSSMFDASEPLEVMASGRPEHGGYPVFDRNQKAVRVSDCYSTPEAAEAATEAATAPGESHE